MCRRCCKDCTLAQTAQLSRLYVRPGPSRHTEGWEGAHILEGPIRQVEVVDVAAAGGVGANLPQPQALFIRDKVPEHT